MSTWHAVEIDRTRNTGTSSNKIKVLTLQEAHKSAETFNTNDIGNVALMQETLLNPFLFPATRSFSASNSRSAKYLLWS